MPLVVSAKISADASNALSVGSDGGLYSTVPTGDANPAYLIDNAWAAAGGVFSYALGASIGGGSAVVPIGSAVLEPFMVTKATRLSHIAVYITNVGNGFLYYALYASNAATGWPTAKVYDLGSVASGSQQVVPLTVGAGVGALAARTLYWLAMWATGTTGPTVSTKVSTSVGLFPIRQPAMPTQVATSSSALLDTSVSWSSLTAGPATVSPTLTVATSGIAQSPPLLWLGLTN